MHVTTQEPLDLGMAPEERREPLAAPAQVCIEVRHPDLERRLVHHQERPALRPSGEPARRRLVELPVLAPKGAL